MPPDRSAQDGVAHHRNGCAVPSAVIGGGGGALEGGGGWRAVARARAQAVVRNRRIQNGWRAVGGSGKRVDRN